MTLRVLALDIEGGFGGSSRSLYELLRHMPRREAEVEVWCRRSGPIQAHYAAQNIPVRVTPDMPHISALPRFSRNVAAFGSYAWRWPRGGSFRRSLRAAAARADVVHCNHEGLFLLARWLRPRTRSAITLHVRTHLPSTVVSRWQYRTIAATADRLAFITENERDRVTELVGRPVPGRVIYNAAEAPDRVAPLAALDGDPRFKVAVLSNYAWIRGIDRLIDVAAALQGQGRTDVVFVIAGDCHLRGDLPGDLGAIARRGGTLADYAGERGVGQFFTFLGHVDRPEAVLAGSDVLAKPTREANPWGRDILEALAAGKPVLSVGRYDRFVETGVTGVLTPEFEAADWASQILRLADDPALRARMGEAAAARMRTLCDGPTQAGHLLALWREAVEARRP
jgi:glycosyltransferase involved in cell wall biosynthesis